MSRYSDETLLEDIRELARQLLDDRDTGPTIRDAGIHRAFTLEEIRAILEKCRTAPFLSELNMQIGYEANTYFRNAYTAIAVARRVGEGDFGSVDVDAATRMIDSNKNVLRDSESGRYLESLNYKKQNFARSIRYSELLPILKEFVANLEVRMLIEQWLPIYKENGNDRLDSDVQAAWSPIQSIGNEILYRYGFIISYPLDWVGKDAIIDGIDLNDDNAARELCSRYRGVVFEENK